jgi:hypothetical protein
MSYVKIENMPTAIGQVETAAGKLQDRIHSVAMSALYHWREGNVDGQQAAEWMTALWNASPYHAAKLNQWIVSMTPFEFSKETKKFYVHADAKMKDGAFKKARDLPFFKKFPADKEPKALDIWQEIEKLLKRVEKHNEKPVEGDVIAQPAIAGLRDVMKLRAA